MANTKKITREVENWYRELLTEKIPDKIISKEKIKLIWGGEFEVDAVVKYNNEIDEIHCLSVSEYKTSGNKNGSGKIQKIKADALMMMGIECKIKVLAFIGETMYQKVLSEQSNGRFPKEIKLKYIKEIKEDSLIQNIIDEMRRAAIDEVSK